MTHRPAVGRLILLSALFLMADRPAHAQLSPPAIQGSNPVGASAGEAATLEVRGKDLDGVSAFLFDDPRIKVEGIKPARLTLPKDIAPGPTSYRVVTPKGISNPGELYVGRPIPVVAEKEPNDGLNKAQAVSIPAAIHGALGNGNDVDVFAVEAKAGEILIAEVIAARAGSGLDALVSIFTPEGRELAADDDLFGLDAAVSASIPASGRYYVIIQDANGQSRDANAERGKTREYRLEVGRLPLITSVFPAGARRGSKTVLRLLGVNLEGQADFLSHFPDTTPVGDYRLQVANPLGTANGWLIRIGDVADLMEAEPNDEFDAAPSVMVPASINGSFAALDDGDMDFYRLRAEPGHEGEYRISAYSARIGSPADPVLTIVDGQGNAQAEDDDKLGRDARLERRIDSKEGLLVSIREHFGRGGPRFVYRIEVEPLERRLAIEADLGSRTLPRDGRWLIPLAVGGRGVNGTWTLSTDGLPDGVTAEPLRLAATAKGAMLVLSARPDAPLGVFSLKLNARLEGAGKDQGEVKVDLTFLERGGKAGSGTIETSSTTAAVAERAPLAVAVEPAESTLAQGGQVEIKLSLDRRDDGATKKKVKVRLLGGEGAFDGLEVPNETTFAADATTATLVIKAKPDASPRRLAVAARAWYEGSPEHLGVGSAPAILIVPEKAR